MQRLLPRFMPMLTSFAARVAGCAPAELPRSAALLARALRDTQKVVGHDGVLCVFEPGLLAAACLDGSGGLRAPQAVVAAPEVSVLLDAVKGLAAQLPRQAAPLVVLDGPSLLTAELRRRCPEAPETADSDYVSDVFTAVLRTALESPAQGVALIESGATPRGPELQGLHRSARRLADFYERWLVQFLLPGTAGPGPQDWAHCSFALSAAGDPCALLRAISYDHELATEAPATTAGDIPAETPVAVVRGLCTEAMQSPVTPAGVGAETSPGSA